MKRLFVQSPIVDGGGGSWYIATDKFGSSSQVRADRSDSRIIDIGYIEQIVRGRIPLAESDKGGTEGRVEETGIGGADDRG